MDKSNHRLSSSINRLRGRKLAPFHIWVLSVVSLLALFTLFIINPDYAGKARSGRLNAAYIENRLPVALNGEWEYYDSRFLFSSDFSASSAEHYSPEYRNFREPSEYLRLWHLPAYLHLPRHHRPVFPAPCRSTGNRAHLCGWKASVGYWIYFFLKGQFRDGKGQPVYRISARHYAADP